MISQSQTRDGRSSPSNAKRATPPSRMAGRAKLEGGPGDVRAVVVALGREFIGLHLRAAMTDAALLGSSSHHTGKSPHLFVCIDILGRGAPTLCRRGQPRTEKYSHNAAQTPTCRIPSTTRRVQWLAPQKTYLRLRCCVEWRGMAWPGVAWHCVSHLRFPHATSNVMATPFASQSRARGRNFAAKWHDLAGGTTALSRSRFGRDGSESGRNRHSRGELSQHR